jgi:hypothetical protein
MLQLGFRHETRRKGYYVDGHEKKATVEYRWDFCERYLLLERQMFRWIQIPVEEAERLQALGKVTKGSGFMYTEEHTGKTMVEYHVDTCKEFMEKMNKESEFGGNLSVRFDPEKRRLVVSQDPTRATHRFVVNDRFGQHCLSRERGKDSEEIQDT